MARSRLSRLSLILAFLILPACGRPASMTSTPASEQTAVALVVLTFGAATQAAALRTPPPAEEATPTFSPPRLYVNTEVQCRSGIGADFRVLGTLPAGTMLDMVGKASAQGAWLVRLPNSAETCWVGALDSSPSGDFQALPEVTPRPGSGAPPAPPTNLSWPFYCNYVEGVLYEITIKLSWMYSGSDANGFRVYRQDTQIADLPVTQTSYTDISKIELGTDLTYGVEAYNEAGASPRLKHTIARVCK